MLPVHGAEVGDKERLLCVGFPVGAEMESVHHAVSEMDVHVTPVQRGQSGNRDFVIVMTVRVLERVSSSSSVVRVRVYDRREESVYKSIGEVLFVVRARKRGRKGRRARDGIEVKVYRGGRREDLELSHSDFGRFGVRRVVVVWF